MLVYIKKRSYVCIRFCCTDWLGNSSILNEKPSQLHIVQWRATPSGSFREPVDYKGQERSNLVFSEFRRSLLYSKTFFMSYLQLSGCRFFLFTGEMCLWKECLAGRWYTNRHTSICYPWYVVYVEGTETSLVWGASMSVVPKSYAVPFCRYDANTGCSNIYIVAFYRLSSKKVWVTKYLRL